MNAVTHTNTQLEIQDTQATEQQLAQAKADTDKRIAKWISIFSATPIPVLKLTARELSRLQLDEDHLSARAITSVVMTDPFMVFKVLCYSQKNKSKYQVQDLIQVEQAVMMMGTSAFFNHIPPIPLVDDALKTNLPALTQLLKLIRRAHRAAHYANDWAVLHIDLHADEVRMAALLHDLAEMLLWCFAPNDMLKLLSMQHTDKHLRSKDAQYDVLGFTLADLQIALITQFSLPPLLSRLMQEDAADDQRVKNVTLAVNLARHIANGWDDAALPDDYLEVAKFLRVDVERAKVIIGVPT